MHCLAKLKFLLPFVCMLLIIICFHYTDFIVLKFYPPIVNFCLFLIFFLSIFQERTVIQKMALLMEPDADDAVMNYTRKVTYVWSVFTFLNFIVSCLTIFTPEKIWTIYNGFISYILVGLVFIIEYIVRIFFKRKHGKR